MRGNVWMYALASAPALFGASCGRAASTGARDAGPRDDGQASPSDVQGSASLDSTVTIGPSADAEDDASLTPEEHALAAFRDAGFQRGLNICTCLASPPLPPEDLTSCAWAESGKAEMLSHPDGERCARELLRNNELLTTYLECEAKVRALLTECEVRTCPNWSPCSINLDCPILPSDLEARWLECGTAFYCADVRADSMRCNGMFECPDHSDERRCGSRIACADQVHLVSSYFLCDGQDDCPDGLDERYCSFMIPPIRNRFLCADGSNINVDLVCDGRVDCPDMRDEAICGPS